MTPTSDRPDSCLTSPIFPWLTVLLLEPSINHPSYYDQVESLSHIHTTVGVSSRLETAICPHALQHIAPPNCEDCCSLTNPPDYPFGVFPITIEVLSDYWRLPVGAKEEKPAG